MDAGNLVSDDVMIGIVQRAARSRRRRSGFVLDGFPRTVVQAAALDRMVDGRGPLVVLDIVVPEDVLVRRLATRPHLQQVRDQRGGRVDGRRASKCGGAAGGADRRWRRHRAGAAEGVSAQTKPLVDYYSARPTFRSINGNQPADVVTAAVDAAVNAAASAGGVAL